MAQPYFPLQTLVLPNGEFGAPAEMYLRSEGAPPARCDGTRLVFRKGATLRTDTYFNALSVGQWKQNCRIDDLTLRLTGRGHFALRFALHRAGQPERSIHETELLLEPGQDAQIALPFWPELDDGLLFYTLAAREDGAELEGAAYATRTAPLNPVHLGLVITHYNRLDAVMPAARRIETELLQDPFFGPRTELVIVDNSRSIDAAGLPHVTVLPNRNLGGSGGFTRGLMHLEDCGRFTHCLFMDDDASCEIEAIRRTLAILCFATEERIAIAGALLRGDEPARLIEKGARFDGYSRALKSGLDMTCVADMIEAERIDTEPGYGGWWFFAFALADLRHYPFPFFVRGDDICFALMNRFSLVTMNGIACWGEDFALKNGPLPLYLDIRHHLLNGMVTLSAPRRQVAAMVWKFFIRQLFSYCYESAAAISLGLDHVSRGPQFWLDNIDTSAARAQIDANRKVERMAPLVDDAPCVAAPPRSRRGPVRDILRWVSLNGLLLPRFLLRRETLLQAKSFSGRTEQIFRYRAVCYRHELSGTGFVALHDRARGLRELALFVRRICVFWANFPRLRDNYAKAFQRLTTRGFWENIYDQEQSERAQE